MTRANAKASIADAEARIDAAPQDRAKTAEPARRSRSAKPSVVASISAASAPEATDHVATTHVAIETPAPSAEPVDPCTTPPPASSKLAHLLALLSHEQGATISDLREATGWQAHSVRGAMAGALRKKDMS